MMMKAVEGLKPEGLWRYFNEISLIPRESRHEGRIRDYIAGEAGRLGLRHTVDRAGNIVVYKPGERPGRAVILQSHLDMVCEKDEGTPHDFQKDPIRLVRNGDWIGAQGTTLGADNGIGVAAMLALMEDPSAAHPDLELLFTIDEETGLTGANLLDTGLLSGRTLINLDSEEDGVFIIGCAGGRSTHLSLDVSFQDVSEDLTKVLVKVADLTGGHSGTDIHRGRGNAIKLLARFLKDVPSTIPLRLASFSGGSKHNVIPREAQAGILVRREDIESLRELADRATVVYHGELSGIDDGVKVLIQEEGPALGLQAAEPGDTARLLDLVHALPHGVMSMNPSMEGLVITSSNLAVCRFAGQRFDILTSQRSIYTSSLWDVSEMVASIARLAGARAEKLHDYPAWRPDMNSQVLDISRRVYTGLFGEEPRVEVIHAGLECAVFAEKMPGIDMISLGPTIEQAHSPSERVLAPTVKKMWVLLTAILNRLTDHPAA
ncbi:MAG: aminoacyl-histidine dipeptidase [Desulfomonilia bacterium]|jgi:dipeptidase D|nr:aminoacyl-histidine dipeptidase [Pseudomonadota bacterium]HON37216.1 aminoacyl-histidine dipeptidase [Deltaproteobacteria bacterium]HRS57109.1 aminoacyl-histidine dipeptidase [Desulfomonilia bacterium]HPD20026.1 aminoacyl-histidine dipeptidase [Deltaproteobacteria bacterium]HPX18586.1 aminoacyl-histidine dipeptidase [Deltaproteobacteria bacterium]